MKRPCPKAIENPARSFLSGCIGPFTQKVQPYQFGDDAPKLTGYWLDRLSPLEIDPEEKVASGEMDEDEFVLKAISILQRKVERVTAERDAARQEVFEAQPKIAVAKTLTAIERPLQDVATRFYGVNMNAVSKSLAEAGYLFRPYGVGAYRVRSKFRDTLFSMNLDETTGFSTISVLPAGVEVMTKLYHQGRLQIRKGFKPRALN